MRLLVRALQERPVFRSLRLDIDPARGDETIPLKG
jgi:hypothetical protein